MSDTDAMPDGGTPAPLDLSGPDAQALEALIATGYVPENVAPAHRERARRLASLLGQLTSVSGAPAAQDRSLIDATLARVMRAKDRGTDGLGVPASAELGPDDEDALEMLVSAGYEPRRVPAAVRARAKRHADLLALLDVAGPHADPEAVVQSTLARIQGAIDSEEARLRIAEPGPEKPRFRLGDLVSVAALLLLAGAVLIPMGGAMREFSRRSSCQASLMAAGLGLGSYANDNKDVLPMASESRAGGVWWSVGDREHSNSANLRTVVRTRYSRLADLACSGNPFACKDQREIAAFDWRSIDEVSFSYQNMFARERPKWVGSRTVVVVSDRSPIVPLAIRGQKINPVSNSLQHGGTGQNMLSTDGVVRWMRTPVLSNGDNAFLPRPLEELFASLRQLNEADPLKGTETPAGPDDTFLTP